MTDEKSHGRSKAGVEPTDEVLERMADEAEAGLDVAKLPRRPGGPAPVRLDPDLRETLDQRAAAERTTASDVGRKALRRYLEAN